VVLLLAMSKNGQLFVWQPLHDKCFEMIKYICCKTPVLVPVNHNKDDLIWVICDALVTGVSAMYGQGHITHIGSSLSWFTGMSTGVLQQMYLIISKHLSCNGCQANGWSFLDITDSGPV